MSQPLPPPARFLRRYARRLHQAGVPAHQLEGLVVSIARDMGYRCDIWSAPTAIFLSLQSEDEDEDEPSLPMQLLRLSPAAINLAETADLYAMSEALLHGSLDAEAANQALKDHPPRRRYPLWLEMLSGGLVSGAFAILLNSAWPGVITAALAGLAAALLFVQPLPALRAGSLEAVVAFLVTLLVYLVNHYVTALDVTSTVMSGLIVLVPGLAFTIAVTELSTDHLSSGSARLAGATITLFKLLLGVLIGMALARWLGWDLPGSADWSFPALPPWLLAVALMVAGLAFAVLFSVRPKDIPFAVLAAVVGYGVSRAGVILGGVELGVLLAALAIALLGNTMGRVFQRPASLIRVPGIILLVPGALGYRAVANVLLLGSPDPRETALHVAILVIALVGGLILGNSILPPRRHI